MSNANRRKKLQDPLYWKSEGHEIQWSYTEAAQALHAFDAMERAKHTKKGRLDNKLSHSTQQFLEWQRQEAEKKLPPINVPLHSYGMPKETPKEAKFAKKRKEALRRSASVPNEHTQAYRAVISMAPTEHDPERTTALGVPDHAPDSLRMAAIVEAANTKKVSTKALPRQLVQRTIKNGWSSATNQLVRSRFLARQTGKDPSEGVANSPVQLSEHVEQVSPHQRPIEKQLMYRAKVTADYLGHGEGELTAQQGNLCFVLGPGGEGEGEEYWQVVDIDGKMGALPQRVVKFLEPCPYASDVAGGSSPKSPKPMTPQRESPEPVEAGAASTAAATSS